MSHLKHTSWVVFGLLALGMSVGATAQSKHPAWWEKYMPRAGQNRAAQTTPLVIFTDPRGATLSVGGHVVDTTTITYAIPVRMVAKLAKGKCLQTSWVVTATWPDGSSFANHVPVCRGKNGRLDVAVVTARDGYTVRPLVWASELPTAGLTPAQIAARIKAEKAAVTAYNNAQNATRVAQIKARNAATQRRIKAVYNAKITQIAAHNRAAQAQQAAQRAAELRQAQANVAAIDAQLREDRNERVLTHLAGDFGGYIGSDGYGTGRLPPLVHYPTYVPPTYHPAPSVHCTTHKVYQYVYTDCH